MINGAEYAAVGGGNYIVTEEGDIFKRLNPPVSSNGYKFVRIGEKSYTVQRIVAMTFIPNPENKPEVNHIDGDKTNNSITNLEWVTRSENMLHASKTGLLRQANKQKACGIRLKLLRLKAVKTQAELAKEMGVNSVTISLWETEDRNPNKKNLKKLADCLGVPVDLLIDETIEHQKQPDNGDQ